jgi:hypothetical protein
MKLITQIKVEPEDPQELLQMMMRFNQVCNYLSERAFIKQSTAKLFDLPLMPTTVFSTRTKLLVCASPDIQAGALSATLGGSQHPSIGSSPTLYLKVYNKGRYNSRADGKQPDAPSQEEVQVLSGSYGT